MFLALNFFFTIAVIEYIRYTYFSIRMPFFLRTPGERLFPGLGLFNFPMSPFKLIIRSGSLSL